ncbi:MAG: hypothetical protein EOO77_33565, partial [Oxalobacteraceae bacterium]
MSDAAPESRSEIVPTIFRAAAIAQEHGHEFVTLEHMLASLLENPDIRAVAKALEADINALEETLTTFLQGPFIAVTRTIPHPTKSFDEVITRCVGTAMFSARPSPRPVDLLVHLLQH